jgi:hypothetical protein
VKFLSDKFFDSNNLIKHFLIDKNQLLELETDSNISEKIKKDFRDSFLKAIVQKQIITNSVIQKIDDSKNPWSIDFPSWFGNFDENVGKQIFVIGSEPHIHYRYLQTVYGFNSKTTTNPTAGILYYLVELLKDYLNVETGSQVLQECYLTDLIPFSPLKSKGTPVGSSAKIQNVIGNEGNWVEIRKAFAKMSLENEIKGVKPKLIITQGKEVFEQIVDIFQIKNAISYEPIIPQKGKKQYIRKINWNGITIISVPHIGSKRIGTFWKSNLSKIVESFNSMLK